MCQTGRISPLNRRLLLILSCYLACTSFLHVTNNLQDKLFEIPMLFGRAIARKKLCLNMNNPLVSDREYQMEARAQAEWLNWVFAIVTFTLSVACLQFPTPWRAALLCLFLVLPMYAYAFFNMPQSLKTLRKLRDEVKSDEIQHKEISALIRHIESKFHGWNVLLRHIPLWFSLALFFCVLFSFKQSFSFILWFKA